MFVDNLGFSSPTMLWKNFWFATPEIRAKKLKLKGAEWPVYMASIQNFYI